MRERILWRLKDWRWAARRLVERDKYRESGQELTGNSPVWGVNIESAKTRLWHYLTSLFASAFCVYSKQKRFSHILGQKKLRHNPKKTKTQTFRLGRLSVHTHLPAGCFSQSVVTCGKCKSAPDSCLIVGGKRLGLQWFKTPAGCFHFFPHSLCLQCCFSASCPAFKDSGCDLRWVPLHFSITRASYPWHVLSWVCESCQKPRLLLVPLWTSQICIKDPLWSFYSFKPKITKQTVIF